MGRGACLAHAHFGAAASAAGRAAGRHLGAPRSWGRGLAAAILWAQAPRSPALSLWGRPEGSSPLPRRVSACFCLVSGHSRPAVCKKAALLFIYLFISEPQPSSGELPQL